MKFILSTILYLLTAVSCAQDVEIKIEGTESKTAALSSVQGEKSTFIDSIKAGWTGNFSFSKENLETGIYRLALSRNRWINFIYDGGKISLETEAAHLLDSMKVLESESNRLYYTFIKLNKLYKTKTELLNLILARYPEKDDYYTVTGDKLNRLQNEYVDFVNIESQEDPLSFIARYIRSSQLPVVDIKIPSEEQISYLKSAALDNVNFNDAELINSDCFTNKSIEYLTYYRNPQFPKGLLEQEFMSAVDTILSKAKINELVYQHVTEYLLDGFRSFGFDLVIDYILQNYVIKDDLCLNEELESSLDRRILQAQKLKVGVTVPNIVLPDENGKEISLDKITKYKTLIVFYASWCPHCKDLMPQIDKLYKKQSTIRTEVVAVSMDSTLADWKSYLGNSEFAWLNVCDTQGWSGKAAQDYYIYATPTMFLVDGERKIIAKPKTIVELKNHF